ncbi:hypothetical protein [Phnomibacter ginsenosidimutans]|jgi:hypothetical protein|nr:hypothetical protein [Phnomibacter ginsenosidimutans]
MPQASGFAFGDICIYNNGTTVRDKKIVVGVEKQCSLRLCSFR